MTKIIKEGSIVENKSYNKHKFKYKVLSVYGDRVKIEAIESGGITADVLISNLKLIK